MEIADKAQRAVDRLMLHTAYRQTFSSESGQRVLKHLMKQFNGDTYVRGDTHDTAHRNGRRYVVCSILYFLHKDSRELISNPEGETDYER